MALPPTLTNPNTPEYAWWLGCTMGGAVLYIRERKARPGEMLYSLSISGSHSLTARWARPATGRDIVPSKMKGRHTWQVVIASKELATWASSRVTGWPEWQDKSLYRFFIRGLCDTTGRIHKNGMSFGSRIVKRNLLNNIITELGQPSSPTIEARTTYNDTEALRILKWLYGDSEEHLRNENRYHQYLNMKAVSLIRPSECHVCGRVANSREPGRWCRRCFNIATGTNRLGKPLD